jgi:hypothetical protein
MVLSNVITVPPSDLSVFWAFDKIDSYVIFQVISKASSQ